MSGRSSDRSMRIHSEKMWTWMQKNYTPRTEVGQRNGGINYCTGLCGGDGGRRLEGDHHLVLPPVVPEGPCSTSSWIPELVSSPGRRRSHLSCP